MATRKQTPDPATEAARREAARAEYQVWLAEREAAIAALWADAVPMPENLEDLASGRMTRD